MTVSSTLSIPPSRFIIFCIVLNKSLGSYLSLNKNRLILSCETFPNISDHLLHPPNFGSNINAGGVSVYITLCCRGFSYFSHCPIPKKLDDPYLSMHCLVILSMRESYKQGIGIQDTE